LAQGFEPAISVVEITPRPGTSGHALADRHDVGDDALVVAAEPEPVPANPVIISSEIQSAAVLARELADAREKPSGG